MIKIFSFLLSPKIWFEPTPIPSAFGRATGQGFFSGLFGGFERCGSTAFPNLYSILGAKTNWRFRFCEKKIFNQNDMKYVIYARKSTEDEDRQILSIEAQIFELKEFAAKEKLEIVASFEEAKTAKE